jgi:hypothetical protein
MRAAAIAILLLAATAARAQELIIYEGDAQKAPIPIVLGGWGSGTATETAEVTGIGPGVLKVTSHGFYSGARLDFGKPYDWSGFVGKSNAFLEFWLRPGYSSAAHPATTAAPRTAYPYAGAVTPQAAAQFQAQKLRILLQTDKGFAVAEPVAFTPGTKDERGWTYVAVPMSTFKGQVSEQVKRLMIFTDRPDVLYISQIRLKLLKLEPMRVNLSSDPVVAKAGQIVKLTAQVEAGPTGYLVTWDFDDRDGIRVDAAGENVIARYGQPGEYVVTCTVTDLSGARPALESTVGVRVVK